MGGMASEFRSDCARGEAWRSRWNTWCHRRVCRSRFADERQPICDCLKSPDSIDSGALPIAATFASISPDGCAVALMSVAAFTWLPGWLAPEDAAAYLLRLPKLPLFADGF